MNPAAEARAKVKAAHPEAVVVEHGRNSLKHRLAAAIVNNPGDLELKARAELIKSWLVKVKLDDLHLPLLLASELEGPP